VSQGNITLAGRDEEKVKNHCPKCLTQLSSVSHNLVSTLQNNGQ